MQLSDATNGGLQEGARIGGRAIGYLAAVLWVAVPFVAIPLFDHRFHEKYVDLTLPQTFGFSGLADFPSTVCLLLAAYLVVRALDSREWSDAVLAGLVAGFALGLTSRAVLTRRLAVGLNTPAGRGLRGPDRPVATGAEVGPRRAPPGSRHTPAPRFRTRGCSRRVARRLRQA